MSTESWVVTAPQVIEIEAVDALRVGLVRGHVDVVARDEPGARIEVHAVDGRPLEVSLADGKLRVGYHSTLLGWESFLDDLRNFRDLDTADVHIAVSRDVAVKLGTVSADGLLAGVRQGAYVSTVSGSLVTDDTSGVLVANTVSGEICVRDHAGDLRLNSVSGDLTASGRFARVAASTVSGPVTLDVTSESCAIAASSIAGDVTVRLPAGRGVSLEARSVSGRVVVDGREHKGVAPGQVKIDLPADGSCTITAKTVSGHLTVLRDQGTPAGPAGA